MKSLLITFDFPPIISGIGTIYYYLWKQMNPENNLILAPKIEGYKIIDRKSELNVFRYFAFYHCRLLRVIVLLFYTFYLIKKEKINILICGVPVSLGLVGLIFKKTLKIPYRVFYWGGEYKKYKQRSKILFMVLERILKDASFVITCSEFTSHEVKEFGIEKDRIFKLIPGVDADIFKPNLDCADLKKRFGLVDKRVLLTVSRLAKRKGIDTVINALPIVRDEFPNITYLIVGSGVEEDYLKALVRERDVEKNVIFVGAVTHEKLPKFYNLCDIYVMPNRETKGRDIIEGFGVSFIEASSCAKPVIGGISGGTGDAVEDGKSGLLVDPENIEMLAQTIIEFLKNDAYAKELGRMGRFRVEKNFRWKSRAKALQELLNNLR